MSETDNKRSDPKPPVDEARAASMRRDIDDVNVWAVVKFAIGILILGIVSYTVLYGMLKLFEHERLESQRRPPAIARGEQESLPPPPRLQMMPGSPSALRSPEYEMTLMREEEEKTLTTYGWVNKDAGTVRIPIEEAMKRLLEKGVPSKPPPAAPVETPARAKSATASGGMQ